MRLNLVKYRGVYLEKMRIKSGIITDSSYKYVAVVVVSDAAPTERSWIITAYITSRLINGEIEWQKS